MCLNGLVITTGIGRLITQPKWPNLEMVFCKKGSEKFCWKPIWRLVWHLANVYINNFLKLPPPTFTQPLYPTIWQSFSETLAQGFPQWDSLCNTTHQHLFKIPQSSITSLALSPVAEHHHHLPLPLFPCFSLVHSVSHSLIYITVVYFYDLHTYYCIK